MQDGPIPILGIGDDGLAGLTPGARQTVESADLIFGSPRMLAALPDSIRAERFAVENDPTELCRRIVENRDKKKIVVLAPGDPLFYGVARFLCDRLGKASFRVIPHVSSMQLAFARIAESWEEAYLANAAAQPLESIIDRIRTAERVGLFTSDRMPPNAIARSLLAEGIDYFRCWVCENLGTRSEVITQGSLAEIGELQFGSLNVMILIRHAETPDRPPRQANRRRFGNPDDYFLQSRPKRGLLTPAEVRTLALARLDLRSDSVVWDVGAGSGSVAIEAAAIADHGRVFAIEPDFEDCELIRQNAGLFNVSNVDIRMARAPEAFTDLPAPDCIFVGGLGRETQHVLEAAFDSLRSGGNLVTNLASIENVSAVTGMLKARTPDVDVLLVSLARGISQLETIRFEAVNPTFLVHVRKSN